MQIRETADCGEPHRGAPVAPDARGLAAGLASYRQPSLPRAILELLVTIGPLAITWGLACAALHYGVWWGLLLVAPAAAFLVRLFMIQHDCGHGSFVGGRLANDWLGRGIGVLTLTPYDYWRRCHAIHHATSGNLDRRSLGGVETLTVAEYAALSPSRRLRYRLYRHPLVLFGLGPAFTFFLQQRLPIGLMRSGWRPWVSAMGTNLAIVLFGGTTLWLVGLRAFLLVNVPIALLAGLIGIWLFYVQHQFDGTFWARDGSWNLREAALRGSSHYDLPPLARWFTANIGLHHIHHLGSRIPFYRLREVLKDHPEFAAVSRITFLQSFRCIGLALWDEASQRMVSFKECGDVRARGCGPEIVAL